MATDIAAIKKRITAFKGHFTRLEYKIRALKCVGNTTTAADTLRAMEEKTEAMMELYGEVVELGDAVKEGEAMAKLEAELMNRQVVCQEHVTRLPLTLTRGVSASAVPDAAAAATARAPQFREQRGLRPDPVSYTHLTLPTIYSV